MSTTLRNAWPSALALAAAALVAALLLALPLRLPLGPNYWDLYTYVDVAHRMSVGQVPHVDFFVPIGALGYALFIGLTKLFPAAHTLLAVHFAILVVALPAMAVVAVDAARRSRAEALALTLPFILFGLIPINGIELYPSPGFDGYGNYNRHGALLLYVLAAALLFMQDRNRTAVLAMLLLAALFMVKVTGLVVALPMVALAALTGRLGLRGAAVGAALVALMFAALQWRYGLMTAYVADIIELVGMNTGFLLPRVMTVLSMNLDVVAAAGLLVAALLWFQRREWLADLRALGGPDRIGALRMLLDRDVTWLALLLAVGAVYETQNTGSHEFIMIWPALVMLLRRSSEPYTRQDVAIILLIAATALPTPIHILHRTARVVASAPKYEPVNAPLLGPVARVSAKSEIMLQSRAKLAHYPKARASYESFAKRNLLPSYILFSEIDFQVSWLTSTQEAAAAILAYEAARDSRFERIVTLDFVDAIPVALGRAPLKEMYIGNDPTRTLKVMDAKARAEIATADAILLPKCPVTDARVAIADIYAPSLAGRRLVALTPCFDMMVKDALASSDATAIAGREASASR